MTLVELLVVIGVIGLIAVVISAAITVTIRQERDTEGRVSLARWEQNLGTWLPNDLASSFKVDAFGNPVGDINSVPTTTPCATPACGFGSNALQLHWNDGSTGDTTVGYRYGPAAGGNSFELRRVECIDGVCTSLTILRNLAGPTDDDGNPLPWNDNDAIPSSVITVKDALAVTETAEDGTTTVGELSQRVIFTVSGAESVDGVDRSARISFTSGGGAFGDLDPPSFSGPSFLEARSGCGGPITLIVDESGSIGSADSQVRTGVRSFVRAFEGTPTQLQIVEMFSKSDTLGATGSEWNKFFDLSEPADVEALIGPGGTTGLVSTIQTRASPNYYTNWEDALFRTFHAENGQSYVDLGNPLAPPPELVVFFTDGLPTKDRASTPHHRNKSDSSSLGPASIPSRFDYESTGSSGNLMSPRGWYRADWVRDQHATRIIGVGVGNSFSANTNVSHAGWPATSIPNEVFLGFLAADGDPSHYDGSTSYIKRAYDPITGWGDVTTADILVTSDFDQFGSALTSIALAECGGTLTVQTRELPANTPADASVTYEIDDEFVTTTRIAKSGTFDIALSGVPSDTVDLVPQSLDGTGYVADSWSCRAGGIDIGGAYSLIEPGNPVAGINITVNANQAVSCTMYVNPA